MRFSGRRPELSRLIRTESSVGGAPFDTLYVVDVVFRGLLAAPGAP